MTLTIKCTSGDWTVRDGQEIIATNGAEVRLIAQCHAGHKEEREANAHLIATAPDLLEALRDCVRVLLAPRNACPELMITVGKLAQKTIAKAEGKAHTLKITSYHDAAAECSCGGWHFQTVGPRTQEVQIRIEEEFQRHQLNALR